MDVRAYLGRIGYNGLLGPTVETLRALHRQHMLTVPFENLDISLGREIVLDPERFVEKVVRQRHTERSGNPVRHASDHDFERQEGRDVVLHRC